MCYSAMIEQNAKVYAIRFNAVIRSNFFQDLFRRRAEGERLYLNKAMEQQFLKNPETTEDKETKELILHWHSEQIVKLGNELEKQEQRLKEANKTLETKTTKKAENDRRIASDKIGKIKLDIQRHKSLDLTSEGEERIYPFHYLSMVCVDENDERAVMPVRYLMRPHNQDESFDNKYNGCYNARLDTIDSVPWWKDSLLKRHGIIFMKKFYENVDPLIYSQRQNIPVKTNWRSNLVVCFQPENAEYICVPALWDVWKSPKGETLYSAALITDDPLPEVAQAGHDRTPIVLSEAGIENWLRIKGKNSSDCKRDLETGKMHVHFSHKVLGGV